MPIYDFRCRECGKVSEMFLHSANQTARCPACGSDNMERLISASYMIKRDSPTPGTTCCGRAERCETPPCSTEGMVPEVIGISNKLREINSGGL